MLDFIFLMHDDTTSEPTDAMWGAYFAALRAAGAFEGGSSIGGGEAVRKAGAPGAVTDHFAGYIRVRAGSLAEAKRLVDGNPVYECGGTVEVRSLPRD